MMYIFRLKNYIKTFTLLLLIFLKINNKNLNLIYVITQK